MAFANTHLITQDNSFKQYSFITSFYTTSCLNSRNLEAFPRKNALVDIHWIPLSRNVTSHPLEQKATELARLTCHGSHSDICQQFPPNTHTSWTILALFFASHCFTNIKNKITCMHMHVLMTAHRRHSGKTLEVFNTQILCGWARKCSPIN